MLSQMLRRSLARSSLLLPRASAVASWPVAPRRFFAATPTTAPLIRTTGTSPEAYTREANLVLNSILERLEAADIDNAFENDVSFSGDVLQLKTERGQTWVLNKHNVTRQIWLSSPLSGPSKYNYHAAAPPAAAAGADAAAAVASATAAASSAAAAGTTGAGADAPGGRWLSERDDSTALSAVLSGEFARTFAVDVQFDHAF